MIDKSMYEAPAGLQALEDEPELEVEIINPDGATIGVDGVEILLEAEPEEVPFDANLAESLDDDVLNTLANDVLADVEADILSRKDWTAMFVDGMEVLGLKYEERTDPWSGACGVHSSLLIEAAVRFQSETIIETFPAQGPVKTQIIGALDKAKEDAAKRVREDMNYQLVTVMTEYRPEHERMLFNLGLAGCAFKKVYQDPAQGRQTAVFVPAEDVILPYGSTGVRTAPRVTHIMRKTENDIKKLQAAGFYRDVELGAPQRVHTDVEEKKAEMEGYAVTDDDRYQIYEIQVELLVPGLDDDREVAVPYILTLDKGTGKVLSLYRNWDENDTLTLKKHHFVQYNYIPGFGAYGMGFIHLIGGYARAGTSLIRQLVDAGTLSNLPGGLKTRGLRVKGDDTPISPGEWRDVDVPSGAIKDNIMALPYKEPSQVLAGLLSAITDEGRRLGSIADLKISDMSAAAPVGTTLAILERQLKTMSAVQARVHFSMKEEFGMLKTIIAESAPAEYAFDPEGSDRKARKGDYLLVEVIPVSDPNSSTMAQRIMVYQAAQQLSTQAPQIYNLPELHRQMLEVLGIKNAEKLVPLTDDHKPRDPISENMGFLTGKPAKAFITQDSDAHIAAHMSFLQDPMIAQQIGQNPMAQQMQAAIMAHVAEHLAFAYRKKIEEQLGAPLPAPDAELPPEMEVQLSRLVARAGVQLTQLGQQQAAQAQAQAQAQDPMFQLQQAEVQIKQAEVQRKAAKDQADAAAKAQTLALQQRKQLADEELREQTNVINAQRAGVMGRSADAQVLREDREAARKLMETMASINQANDLGASSQKPEGGGQ